MYNVHPITKEKLIFLHSSVFRPLTDLLNFKRSIKTFVHEVKTCLVGWMVNLNFSLFLLFNSFPSFLSCTLHPHSVVCVYVFVVQI